MMMLTAIKDDKHKYNGGKRWILSGMTVIVVVLGYTGTVLADENVTDVNMTRTVRPLVNNENESVIYSLPVETAGIQPMASKKVATSQLTASSVANRHSFTTNLIQVRERSGFWLQVASILLLGLMTYAGGQKRVDGQ